MVSIVTLARIAIVVRSRVKAFPSARHHMMVDMIARAMAACASIDSAEARLIDHLEIHWDRLETFGVDCAEIEVECRGFAAAAWRRYQEVQHEAGAA